MTAALESRPALSLRHLLHRAAQSVYHGLAEEGLGNADVPPVCACGIVRLRGDLLEWAVLADITIILDRGTSVELITDSTIAPFTRQLERIVAEWSLRDLPADERAFGVAEAKRQFAKQHLNRERGYWALGPNPEAAQHAVLGSTRAAGVRRILLASDGFSRVVDTVHMVPSWSEAFSAIDHRGLSQLVTELRLAEERGASEQRMHGLKMSDDATAVLVEVSALDDNDDGSSAFPRRADP